MAKKTQQRPPGVFSGRLYGSFAGKPPEGDRGVGVLTQQRPPGVFSGRRYGSFAGKGGAGAATITAVDPVSGTELQVTWTGTASRYRLDGGTPAALPDGASPDTISGLTPNTLYAVEIDNGDGNWSNSVSEWTDNTGGGGGLINSDAVAADGAASVSAVGASTAATTATAAAGLSTVSRAGSSLAATNAAAASGSATVSGVGSSLAAGETVAVPAAGLSTVGAQGASTARATATAAAGLATVSAVGSFVGDTTGQEVILLSSHITTALTLGSSITTTVALRSHI